MNGPLGGIAALIIVIALFLIFRAVVLWYWRVNAILEQLQQINQKLAALVRVGSTAPADLKWPIEP